MTDRTLLVKKHILANFHKGEEFSSDHLMKIMKVKRSDITPSLTQLRRDGIIAIFEKRRHTFIYKIAKFVSKSDQLDGFAKRKYTKPFTKVSPQRKVVVEDLLDDTDDTDEQSTIGVTITANIPEDQLGTIIRTIKQLDPKSSIRV